MTDIAIAHWGEYCDGGGERVAWDLQRALDAPLYVSHQDREIEPEDVTTREVDCPRPVRMMLEAGDPWRMVAHQLIWQVRPELTDAETLVSSGNEPLAYVPPDGQTWVAYVHHTSRMATDLLHTYADKYERAHKLPVRYAAMLIRWAERQAYTSYATKPDRFVANSELVAQRLQRYWGVPEDAIDVVYPAVDCDVRVGEPGGDSYFAVSRLYPEKHIADIAETCGETGRQLKIAGRGPQADTIEALARQYDSVEYLGYVSEGEKRRHYREARATIFAAEGEDFGLVPVESMAHGTPVIGVNDGFTGHQVVDGATGVTFEREGLADALARFEREGVGLGPFHIQTFADSNFGTLRFERELRESIERAQQDTEIDVEWDLPDAATVGDQPAQAATDGGQP